MYNLLFEYPTHRVPNIPLGISHVLAPGNEIQPPRVVGRVPTSRPIVAVHAYVAHGRIAAATGGGKEHRVPIGF